MIFRYIKNIITNDNMDKLDNKILKAYMHIVCT